MPSSRMRKVRRIRRKKEDKRDLDDVKKITNKIYGSDLGDEYFEDPDEFYYNMESIFFDGDGQFIKILGGLASIYFMFIFLEEVSSINFLAIPIGLLFLSTSYLMFSGVFGLWQRRPITKISEILFPIVMVAALLVTWTMSSGFDFTVPLQDSGITIGSTTIDHEDAHEFINVFNNEDGAVSGDFITMHTFRNDVEADYVVPTGHQFVVIGYSASSRSAAGTKDIEIGYSVNVQDSGLTRPANSTILYSSSLPLTNDFTGGPLYLVIPAGFSPYVHMHAFSDWHINLFGLEEALTD